MHINSLITLSEVYMLVFIMQKKKYYNSVGNLGKKFKLMCGGKPIEGEKIAERPGVNDFGTLL